MNILRSKGIRDRKLIEKYKDKLHFEIEWEYKRNTKFRV